MDPLLARTASAAGTHRCARSGCEPARQDFEEWRPEEPLRTFYQMSKSEWQPDGCGELPLWKCDPEVKALLERASVAVAMRRLMASIRPSMLMWS